MLARKFMVAMAVVGLWGCGSAEWAEEDVPEREALAVEGDEVIVGSVNWKSTNSLSSSSMQAKNAKAVGYLSIPSKGTRCTAWLIAEDLVVTNHHCIATDADAVGAKVAFNYEDDVPSYKREWYSCGTLVGAWKDLDAAVLRCSARSGVLPGEARGWLQLADADASNSQSVYVIHQNCDYYTTPGCAPTKKYSPGYVKSAYHSSTEISYTADTLGGSSGSAVFAVSGTGKAHKVVALHHVGIGGDSEGRGTKNAGVKVSLLKARLQAYGIL